MRKRKRKRKRKMKVTSEIKAENGVPRLFVSGKEQSGLAYITYINEKACYSDFAKAGYKLFSVSLFFGTNHLNERSGQIVFSKGIFDNDTPDYSEFDANIERLLLSCPDAMIIPRVNVSPSRKWELDHPEELCDTGLERDPECKRVCFSSDVWAEEAKRELSAFVLHVESMPFADNVIGYQIAAGNTEEWLPFDMSGSVGLRSREKYAKHLASNGLAHTEGEKFKFLSSENAKRVIDLAEHLKRITEGRLVVGAFYGYTFETYWRESAHHALEKLLRSDAIDFICSPISYCAYSGGRVRGVDHAYMLPLSSLIQHKKLYFSENDTRTHNSLPPNDLPHYKSPVWFGPDKETSLEILKMHYARALINGHALWWFDMWGGWYHDDDYMSFMKKALEISKNSETLDFAKRSEIAVFIDEEACSLAQSKEDAKRICHFIRRELGWIGAPYDSYLASDFDAVKERYKACILLSPAMTELGEKIKEYADRRSLPLFVVDAKSIDVCANELRAFCKDAGVHIYCNENCVIYANERYLFVHTASEGECRLNIKDGKRLYEVFENKYYSTVFDAPLGKSCLFRLE